MCEAKMHLLCSSGHTLQMLPDISVKFHHDSGTLSSQAIGGLFTLERNLMTVPCRDETPRSAQREDDTSYHII
ncbi:hypothetical protein DNTS_006512 [Danionella cerebrum]|uniref:Uncharacterized protein n=1 Tax=Danionella cerebrum TaxID=2873325 RepID=A0A553MZD7_9TELE|nr:hypothetical protein DNTS_006512 [Danionella translucida]